MSARLRWTKAIGAVLLAVLCLASVSSATTQSHKKPKKPAPPPLPSGPTGPVQQIPLDSIAAVAPQVSFQNDQLTIVAPNSTLADILRAVKKLTGAEIDIPSAPERVVTHLGPGPARLVMAELLNGSRFNYVLLGSASDENGLSRVVLVAKSGPQDIAPNNPTNAEQAQGMQQPGVQPQANAALLQQPPEANDAEPAPDDANADDNNEQNSADADQPQENPGVKTPQQMLQEMQQRQLQLQQNQPPGQPPVPGMPPRPQEQ